MEKFQKIVSIKNYNLRSFKKDKNPIKNMGTRALIDLYDIEKEKPTAVVYRHNNGDPEGLGRDLLGFVDEIRKNTFDIHQPQFDDASYLAAKWIVYDAIRQLKNFEKIRVDLVKYNQDNPESEKFGMNDKEWIDKSSKDQRHYTHKDHYLGFEGIGILRNSCDRTDIDHHYKVICDGNPTILYSNKNLKEIVKPRKVEGGLFLF